MVMTKPELIASLQNEVRILLHLAGKFEPGMRDYRPTPTQRSAFELLQYLSIMGPVDSLERYRFGSFELQPDQRRLLKDGATISLRPRAFDLCHTKQPPNAIAPMRTSSPTS